MCKVTRPIGALTTIRSRLEREDISMSSLYKMLDFERNYTARKKEIISEHAHLISNEKYVLECEISQLKEWIEEKKTRVKEKHQIRIEELSRRLEQVPSSPSNIFQRLNSILRKHAIKRKIHRSEISLEPNIASETRPLTRELNLKNNRYQFITQNFDNAVEESCRDELLELERKMKRIIELKPLIYGAFGEQKVMSELENLPDDFHLINDFCLSFKKPIYNRRENDYISSVQIDHLLISPAGIFIIETKNWSNHSLNDINLWSPVEQIKRTSFALFRVLGDESSRLLGLEQHHWGERKIPIRNIIVFINNKPKVEFQNVKILSLRELLSYIRYFKPCFSTKETDAIAKYLLNLTVNLP